MHGKSVPLCSMNNKQWFKGQVYSKLGCAVQSRPRDLTSLTTKYLLSPFSQNKKNKSRIAWPANPTLIRESDVIHCISRVKYRVGGYVVRVQT